MDSSLDEVVEVVVEKQEEVLPGFRFHPTDEELLGFYLRRKVDRKPIRKEIIKQVDIYKYDPWDLPKVSNVSDKEWYFFCLRGRKYRNSIRPNRVTGSGFWKATGIDRPIYAAGGHHNCVGLKKSLVYYRGSAGKGTKTDWMMHEFRLPPDGAAAAAATCGKTNGTVNNSCNQEGETWTLCRIFKRTISYKRHEQAQSWRATSTKQAASTAGLSSKSCSPAESNITDDDYRQVLPANSTFQQISENNSVFTFHEDKWQGYAAGQGSSPPLQAASPASYTSFPGPNTNDFVFGDGSWDELGRIVEFSVDPQLMSSTVDTRDPSTLGISPSLLSLFLSNV